MEAGGSCWQNAGLTNRKGIEAGQRGEQANLCEAQCLHGRLRRRSDRYKREGECVIPGEIWRSASVLLTSRGVGKDCQKSAEAIVAVLRRELPLRDHRFCLNLDQHFGIDKGCYSDHQRCRANPAKEFAVRFADFLPIGDVSYIHSSADDIL